MCCPTRIAQRTALREDAGLSQQDLADELNSLSGRKYGKYPNPPPNLRGS
jgi:hypothetical protein